MTVSLLAAADADWPAAWQILREAFRDLTRRVGVDIDGLEAECQSEWRTDQTRRVVRDGRVVGFVRLENHPDHDWLDLVVVAPEDQGAGIGADVMQVLMDEAAARGVPLWLSVYRLNESRRLYRRLGFAERERDEVRMLMVYPPTYLDQPPRGPGRPR